MQQNTRSYLTTFVAKTTVLLFCSLLLHGLHAFAIPTMSSQQINATHTSQYHKNTVNSRQTGTQSAFIEEKVNETLKLSSSIQDVLWRKGDAFKNRANRSSGYIHTPFINIATVRLRSVFLLI